MFEYQLPKQTCNCVVQHIDRFAIYNYSAYSFNKISYEIINNYVLESIYGYKSHNKVVMSDCAFKNLIQTHYLCDKLNYIITYDKIDQWQLMYLTNVLISIFHVLFVKNNIIYWYSHQESLYDEITLTQKVYGNEWIQQVKYS